MDRYADQSADAVPADAHYGTQVPNPYSDGSFGVPAHFGSPPAVWCTHTTINGEPCKGKHLPDREYCFAHAPKGE